MYPCKLNMSELADLVCTCAASRQKLSSMVDFFSYTSGMCCAAAYTLHTHSIEFVITAEGLAQTFAVKHHSVLSNCCSDTGSIDSQAVIPCRPITAMIGPMGSLHTAREQMAHPEFAICRASRPALT